MKKNEKKTTNKIIKMKKLQDEKKKQTKKKIICEIKNYFIDNFINFLFVSSLFNNEILFNYFFIMLLSLNVCNDYNNIFFVDKLNISMFSNQMLHLQIIWQLITMQCYIAMSHVKNGWILNIIRRNIISSFRICWKQ